MIPFNKIAYSVNTLNGGSPKEANQNQGKGFFSAPARRVVDAAYVRDISPTFLDYWTQPRLLFNSLLPAEQQMVVNAIRFELSKVGSVEVRKASIAQLNKISHDLAKRAAVALGVDVPAPDSKYYHNSTTAGVSIFKDPLPTIAALRIGIFASTSSESSFTQAAALRKAFEDKGAFVTVMAEFIKSGVDQPYSASDAVHFDGIIVVDGIKNLFDLKTASSMYPNQRPASIVRDAYLYGKPVGVIGDGNQGLKVSSIETGPGVYVVDATYDVQGFADKFENGLKTFKFLDRFAMD